MVASYNIRWVGWRTFNKLYRVEFPHSSGPCMEFNFILSGAQIVLMYLHPSVTVMAIN
jgi:hypothetical protein